MPVQIWHKPSEKTCEKWAKIIWKFNLFFAGFVSGVGLYKFFLSRWF